MNKSILFSVAQKEFKDALSNKVFLALLLFLLFLTGISIMVGAFSFQSKVALYNSALEQLKQAGQGSALLYKPQFYPLQMLRATIEYLEIIGAVLAILLGYISVAKEKGTNTLKLVFVRPINHSTFVLGKILGNGMLLALVLGVMFLFIYLAITLVGGITLSQLEVIKLILSYSFSFVYLLFFFCLSSFISFLSKSLPNALIISFIIWLVFVLLIPQIGDTMDPDNQVPGGFFASINVSANQKNEIMNKFRVYEGARNVLEESSLTKHYERATFAMLGIKDIYNGKGLGVIFHDKWNDIVWLVGFLLGIILLENKFIVGKRILKEEYE